MLHVRTGSEFIRWRSCHWLRRFIGNIRQAARRLAHLATSLLEEVCDRVGAVVSLARVLLPLFLILAVLVIDLLRAAFERKPRLSETEILEQLRRHLVQKL